MVVAASVFAVVEVIKQLAPSKGLPADGVILTVD